MRKILLYIVMVAIAGSMCAGCNTLKGIKDGLKDGIKEDWETVKRWDSKMREKW